MGLLSLRKKVAVAVGFVVVSAGYGPWRASTVADSGSASEHIADGRQSLRNAFDRVDRWRVPPGGIPVPVQPLAQAATEFEAALFLEPLNGEAALGLAKCLLVRAQELKGPEADTIYRRVLALSEEVARRSTKRSELAEAWEAIGEAQNGRGDHGSSRRSYERLLELQKDGVSRLCTRGLIAEQDEHLGHWQAAADGYRLLARADGEPGWYADKVREMEQRAAQVPSGGTRGL